jgi:signal transduction histidine kinase/serine phosphatase RsbU (regulator of sigma subunit)
VPVTATKKVWSKPYDWYGITMTSFLNPFFDESGKMIGVAGADVNVTALTQQLNEPVVRKGGYFAILNEQGNLLAYPPIPEKAKARESYKKVALFNAIWAKIQQDKAGMLQVNGTFLGYQRILSTQWLMLAVVPRSVVLGPVFAITVAGTLGAGIVLALVVMLFVRRLNRRLQPILNECHTLIEGTDTAQGELTQQIDIAGVDELEVLDRSFNHMATQLKASFDTLETKNAELQRLDQLKDEFLANTSHELRTPLNGIIGIAESLIDGAGGQLSETLKKNLLMIAQSGHRLTNLVNDILDFAKLKHHEIELQVKPVSLREIVEIVLMLSQPLKGQKDLQLINAIAPELPPALADENRVQQIMYNLVGNAIKFTESGKVEIAANSVDAELIITVSDTGIGIQADKIKQIFQAFEQAEGATAREYGGTGLGLAVTKKLVELHRGKIWVESAPGLGSRFIFTLPISEPAESVLRQSTLLTHLVSTDTPTQLKPPQPVDNIGSELQSEFKILIVDDEAVNLQVLVNHLSLHNYAVTQASSGPEALALLEEGLKPDLILLDVMMPKMTGYEVVRKIRDKWQASELPTLLLTAKNQISDLVTGLEAGANDYLTKPISKDELLARIKTHINIKHLKEENLRMSAELEVSRRLQQMLLPHEKELSQIDGLEIAGFMEPADEVGGDFYDVLQHNGRVLMGIGDVTGHGLESGALAIMVQSSIRTLLANNETDPVKFFSALNQMVFHNVERMKVEKSLTLALVDLKDGQMSFSGQHEQMIVVRAGEVELIDTVDLGFPIGLEEDIADFVSQISVRLNQGDVVVLYTDGITEAENTEGTFYGLERLCEIVKHNCNFTVDEIRQVVIDDVRQFIGKQKVFDDITLLVLKQK